MNDGIMQRIKQEKKVGFVSEISYNNKNYIKTVKLLEKGIEYIYYEIQNGEIKKVENQEILTYLKENYEINERSINY